MKDERDYKLIADNIKDMLDSGKSISEILRMSHWKKEKHNIEDEKTIK